MNGGAVDRMFRAFSDRTRLRILHQPNSGKSVALNLFLDRQAGAYYAILDADDLSHPRRVERQVAYLESHPELGACFTGHELILDGKHIAPRSRAKGTAECARDIERLAMPASQGEWGQAVPRLAAPPNPRCERRRRSRRRSALTKKKSSRNRWISPRRANLRRPSDHNHSRRLRIAPRSGRAHPRRCRARPTCRRCGAGSGARATAPACSGA